VTRGKVASTRVVAVACAAAVVLGCATSSALCAEPAVTELTGGVTPGFSFHGGPYGIAAGPDGNIWITEFLHSGRVAKITPAGVVTEMLALPANGIFSRQPREIATGPDGNMWFTGHFEPFGPGCCIGRSDPGWVSRITPDGVVTEFTGGVTPGFSADGAPQGIAAGPDANMWFTEPGVSGPGRVARITPDGGVTEFTAGVAPGLSPDAHPYGIATDSKGNIWFTDRGGPGRISRITPAGVVTVVATGGVTPGFSANAEPDHIVAAPDGSIWFTENADPGRVGRIGPAGVVTEFTGGVTPGLSANGGPAGITTGPEGDIWFTEERPPGRVARITPAGVVTELTGGVTPGFSATDWLGYLGYYPLAGTGPFAIATGPDGDLWFTVYSDPGRVGRINPAAVPPAPHPAPPPAPSNALTIIGVHADRHGVIRITGKNGSGGTDLARATIARHRAAVAPKRSTVTYGVVSNAARGPGLFTLRIRPSKAAKRLLSRKRRVKVLVSVTFTPTGGSANKKTVSIVVRLAKRRSR
jgi:virginiamycin B lyase